MPRSGTVVGTVRGYGGPATIVHGKVQPADNGNPMTNSTVTARRTDGLIVKTSTGPLGHYAMSVPPGRWTLQTECSTSVTVTVASSRQVRVPLRCDFP